MRWKSIELDQCGQRNTSMEMRDNNVTLCFELGMMHKVIPESEMDISPCDLKRILKAPGPMKYRPRIKCNAPTTY